MDVIGTFTKANAYMHIELTELSKSKHRLKLRICMSFTMCLCLQFDVHAQHSS